MSQQQGQKSGARKIETLQDDNAGHDLAGRLVAMIEATFEYAECLLLAYQPNSNWCDANNSAVPAIYLEAPARLQDVWHNQEHWHSEAGKPVLVISVLGVQAEGVSEKAFAMGMAAAQSAVRGLFAAVFDNPAHTNDAS